MEIAIAPVKKETAADPARTQKLPAPPRQKLATQTWVARLNPVSFWRASRSSVFSAQPVVQSELSLDSVKVVHNDLSDVDVEIVPIKSRASALAAKVTTQPAKKTWEVLGERIMRATAL